MTPQRLNQGHLQSHPWGIPYPTPNPLCSLLIFNVGATKSKAQGVWKVFTQLLMQVWGPGGGEAAALRNQYRLLAVWMPALLKEWETEHQ